jgi:hypothetical protein
VFKVSPLGSYFAGIATVVIALSAGFAGGAHVGSSWGSVERLPAGAATENRPMLTERREIPLVQAVAAEPLEERAIAPKVKADKAAAARKDAAERRKIARAERRKTERSRQIALAARKMQASEISSTRREELKAPSLGSSLGLGFAPPASSQPPFVNDRAPRREAP